MDMSFSANANSFIKEQMATGLYASVNDILEEAISLLQLKKTISKSEIDAFNAEIAKGEADIAAGRYSDANEFFKEVIAQYD